VDEVAPVAGTDLDDAAGEALHELPSMLRGAAEVGAGGDTRIDAREPRVWLGLRHVQDDAGRPSMVPAETGRPISAPVGKSSRLYAPAMTSPSDVSTGAV